MYSCTQKTQDAKTLSRRSHPSFLFSLCGDRNKASSRVRGYWIAEALASTGIKCTLAHRHSKAALLLFAIRILFHDVVVFQKTYSRWHRWLMNWANFLNKTTLIDLDDAPSRINSPVTLRNVEAMMRCASAVTVGSQALFNYTSQFSQNVQLVPSSISLKYYQVPDQVPAQPPAQPPDSSQLSNAPICLGWIGNGSHYKADLITTLQAPLRQIASKQPLRFKLIGACGEQDLYRSFQNIPGLELDFIDQIEWSDPNAVAAAIRDIDIGLYPLLPNDFNQFKCGFKALEYMAMKIPVVSSDVAENRDIIEAGVNGLFASTSGEWVSQLMYLLNNPDVRQAMGRNGRQKVEQAYSIASAVEKVLTVMS